MPPQMPERRPDFSFTGNRPPGSPPPEREYLDPNRPRTGGGLQYQPSAYRGYGGGIGDLGRGAGTGIGGLIGLLDQGPGGKRELERILQLYSDLQKPDFNIEDLTPAQLELVALMEPETYEAQLPGAAAQIADSPEMRAEQLQALGGLGQIAEEGLPEADRLAAEEGARAMRGALRSGEENLVQSLRRRGRLGGGGEIAARAVGGRLASELGRGLSSDITREALQRRLQALSQYGSAAGAVRGQDVTSQMVNADALNRFTLFASQQSQQAAADAARERQRVQTYNVMTPQRLQEQQAMQNFQTQQYNQAYQNQQAQQAYQNQLSQVAGQAGALGGISQAGYAEQAAKQKTYEDIGGGLGSLAGLGSLESFI